MQHRSFVKLKSEPKLGIVQMAIELGISGPKHLSKMVADDADMSVKHREVKDALCRYRSRFNYPGSIASHFFVYYYLNTIYIRAPTV
jgi:hypothetical protein